MKTLSIVCPVYNEEEVIEKFHAELARVTETLRKRWDVEILYVVDLCRDRTLPLLKQIAESDRRVRILSLSSRFGHQMSLLAGIDHARSDAVLMMDSDLQHPPKLIPKLLEEFEKGIDIVYTVRRDAADVSFLRRLASKLYYGIFNRLSGQPISPNAADFRVVSQRVAEIFRTSLRERNLFVRGMIRWMGFSSVAVEFDADERAGGKTKYSLSRLLRFASQGVVAFSRRPLSLPFVVGGWLLGLAPVGAVLSLALGWPGWSYVLEAVFFAAGLNAFFLGVLGEYVGTILDEVRGRPHYLIDEKIGFRTIRKKAA